MSRLERSRCRAASARLVSGIFMLLLIVSSCSTTGSEPNSSSTSASQPGTTPTPSASRPPVTDLEAAGAKRLDVVGDWLTVTDDGIWIAGKNSKRLPELFRLAPADGKVVSSVAFRSAQCGGAAVWDGYLWTATVAPTGVAKIDTRRSKIVKEVQLKTPDELDCELTSGAGEGGVWVIINAQDCVQCRIAKLDRNLRVMATIPVKAGAAAVRAGLGSVWVSNPEEDVVEQIDPKTLKVVNQIPTGDRPRYMAIGAGSVWALAQVDGTITRYTPETKKTVRIEADLPGAGGDLTFGAGSLWARGAGDRLLLRLDPATNQVVTEYGPAVGAGAVAVGHGAVWISAYNAKKVWRLPLPK